MGTSLSDKPQTASQCLRAAKALIDVPEHWTKNALGRDAKGEPVWLSSSDRHRAVSYCAVGALLIADGPAEITASRILNKVTGGDLVRFNNALSTTHNMMMAKFDEAIKLAEQEEAGAKVPS